MTTAAISAPPTTNKHLTRWVEKMADLCQPDRVHWVDGSDVEYHQLCEDLITSGTFICSLSKDNAGPTNNWEEPFVMHRKLKQLFRGCMRGRTMYVLAYSMGPVGSAMSQIGVQLTDSA